jgi:hypothetical protein
MIMKSPNGTATGVHHSRASAEIESSFTG